MTDISQSYKELGIPYFKEVFDLIDETMREAQIPYYLLGATAIDLELLKDGIKPSRGSKDIDFAVMVSSLSEYEAYTERMINKGFVKVAAPWTFRHPKFDVVIDILPFGEIEEHYTVNFNNRHTDLHVLGFKEVMSEPTQIQIEEIIVNIPTLQGFIILKLVAWSDRPEERENDLGDILKIISRYYMLMWDDILTHHYDLIPEEEDIDEKKIAAHILGRLSAQILLKSEPLKERILSVVESNISASSQSAIAKDWAIKLDETTDYTLSLLQAFLDGLNEKL